ncbi:hypothetical protein [Fumia xinanensis]|uniref:Uncharacterized protein n=1 Tax=Fumia xinanensis TaxID=2763659 RepID=A0A926I2Y0_9FIRM|nr:hypothetical protein [Fumia xinanensis]MBC8560023.1 hypothetical protein [Fumia xinanensis]PWL41944.1 MAG: hypothetical protein DBY45_09360 [Clostridiales bacterium]
MEECKNPPKRPNTAVFDVSAEIITFASAKDSRYNKYKPAPNAADEIFIYQNFRRSIETEN